MNTTPQTPAPAAAPSILGTVLQTAASIAPALAAADPKVAAVVALAPVAITLLTAATQLQQAGVIPAQQLVDLFQEVGNGIQSTHDEWAAMNAADAAKAGSQ